MLDAAEARAAATEALTTMEQTARAREQAEVAARDAVQALHWAKTNPSTADMLAKLRRVLIATRFRLTRPEQPTPAELQTTRLAWKTQPHNGET